MTPDREIMESSDQAGTDWPGRHRGRCWGCLSPMALWCCVLIQLPSEIWQMCVLPILARLTSSTARVRDTRVRFNPRLSFSPSESPVSGKEQCFPSHSPLANSTKVRYSSRRLLASKPLFFPYPKRVWLSHLPLVVHHIMARPPEAEQDAGVTQHHNGLCHSTQAPWTAGTPLPRTYHPTFSGFASNLAAV